MSKKFETIIINSLNKLDSKIDKIEGSSNDIKTKVILIGERQVVLSKEVGDNKIATSSIQDSIKSHTDHDAEVQTHIVDKLKDYNQLLEIHIEGVKTLKKLHIQNSEKIDLYKTELDKRISKLEDPIKAKEYLYKKYIKVGGAITLTCAIIGGIAKVVGLF